MGIDITNVIKYKNDELVKAEKAAARQATAIDKEEYLKKIAAADKERQRRIKKYLPAKTPEEKASAEFNKMVEAEKLQQQKEVVKTVVPNVEAEWDVKKDDPIEFFDNQLSYELTGYRPLTKDKGLDFDPTPFSEAALRYIETGHHCPYPPDTIMFVNFWKREQKRCQEGLTIGKYHITGDNYFWLNYYRLLNTATGEVKQSGGRKKGFPTFIAKQYEYFHYIELCRATGHDFCILKPRAIGASEIACSLGANLYTTTPNTYQIYTAFGEAALSPTISRCWQELDFLNGDTDGGFKHLRQKTNTKDKKVASKVDKFGREFGHMATIEAVVTDNPRKLRGNRVENIFFEEAGSHPHLEKTFLQSEPLVVVGGDKIGTRYVFGTGGDSGPALEGLTKMFNHPKDYNILPFRHNYTTDKSEVYTAYFIPAYSIWFGDKKQGIAGFDHRGVTDEEAAKKWYETRWSNIVDAKTRIIDQAEHCFTPQQALILEGDNQFDQDRLVHQLAEIQIQKSVETPKHCKLCWGYTDGMLDKNTKPKVEYEPSGKILMLEEPILDSSGYPVQNLYVAGIDSIDADASTSTGQKDVSKFAMIVYKRVIGLDAPRPVAIYKDRPKDIREAYDNALKLAQFYNCKIVLEATRINVVNHFKNSHHESYFMHRPTATIGKYGRPNKRQIGVPATAEIIMHQLELIEMYINDYCEYICFEDILDEAIRYSFENKRKFDLIAAFGMALLGDEELRGKTPRAEHQRAKDMKKIGYYINEYGQKEFGIIPKTEPIELYGNLGI